MSNNVSKVGGCDISTIQPFYSQFDTKVNSFLKLASTASAGPSARHIIPEFTPISDQGFIGSCVGNATADLVEILKGLEDPTKVVQVSRLFLYYNARNYSGTTNLDKGTTIANAMDSMKRLGVCREEVWPYDVMNVFTKPTIESYREASSNTFADFYQIGSTGSDRRRDIEIAIRANHPVAFAVEVDEDFHTYYNGTPRVFNEPSKSIGRHAMIITGFRYNASGQIEFYVRNSWGSDFGISEPETAHLGAGHAWLSASYIDSIPPGDAFVGTRMIDFTL